MTHVGPISLEIDQTWANFGPTQSYLTRDRPNQSRADFTQLLLLVPRSSETMTLTAPEWRRSDCQASTSARAKRSSSSPWKQKPRWPRTTETRKQTKVTIMTNESPLATRTPMALGNTMIAFNNVTTRRTSIPTRKSMPRHGHIRSGVLQRKRKVQRVETQRLSGSLNTHPLSLRM